MFGLPEGRLVRPMRRSPIEQNRPAEPVAQNPTDTNVSALLRHQCNHQRVLHQFVAAGLGFERARVPFKGSKVSSRNMADT